jgi:hypothetical protein
MNKSFFYSTVASIAFGMAIVPSTIMAQTVASAPQPASSIADLQNAIGSETPDLTLIQSLVANLIAQDANNIAQIQAVAVNASPTIQAAINTALGATGSVTTGSSAPSAPAGTSNIAGATGGGASGDADDVLAALKKLQDEYKAAQDAANNANNTANLNAKKQQETQDALKAAQDALKVAQDALKKQDDKIQAQDVKIQELEKIVSPN